jgi:hypothetical protein
MTMPEQAERQFGIRRTLKLSAQLLGLHGGLFLGIAALLNLPALALGYANRHYQMSIAPAARGTLETAGLMIALALAVMLISTLCYSLVQGAITQGCLEALEGRQPAFRACVTRSFAAIRPMLLLTAIVLVGVLLLGFVIGVVFALVHDTVIRIIIGTAAGAAFAYVVLIWWLLVPAVVIERIGAIAGMRRSHMLTKGRRWRILGLLLSVMIPVAGGTTLLMRALQPAPETVFWLNSAISIAASTLGAVMPAVGYALLRREKEGVGAAEAAAVFD